MTQMTITEALAELKLIGAKVKKKRQNIAKLAVRWSNEEDPIEGGSNATVARERQSITDLLERGVRIRSKIQSANLASLVTVGPTTRTVADWLIWRREFAADSLGLLSDLDSQYQNTQKLFRTNPQRDPNDETRVVTPVFNFEIEGVLTEQVEHNDILNSLDGKLSLHNATTTIEV